ncbi:MAG: ABC transporter ATP-binding protein [Firmicutes bacterium]|nr:ABC transporter ATP-binding protein [Bacillota bacterium]
MSVAVSCQGVTKHFQGRVALDEIHWTVEAGRIHGLIGANGAGKTTLLRLVLGILRPDQGRVTVLGDLAGPGNARLRQQVVYVASHQALPRNLTVRDWLRYLSLLYSRWDEDVATRLMTALEIDPAVRLRNLSTGAQASFKIAAALAARPDLLLLDEALNGMDVVVKHQVIALLLDWVAAQGTTLVLATHTLDDVERIADAVSIVYRGRMLLTEDLERLKDRVQRVQVVAGPEWMPAVLQHPEVIDVDWRGHVGLVTVEGPLDRWSERLRQAGALIVEPVDVDLTEIFRMVLKREGYTRDAVAWHA